MHVDSCRSFELAQQQTSITLTSYLTVCPYPPLNETKLKEDHPFLFEHLKQSEKTISNAMILVTSSLFYCLSLLSMLPSITSTTIRGRGLHFHTTQNPSQDPFQRLNNLVSSSLARAQHLKNPRTTPTSSTTSIFSHSYGGYSISLSFGTPPQTLSFIMDTGSSFVWFPCTTHYHCKNCSFSSSSSTSKITSFIPKYSSSSKIIGCKNPKCSWLHKNLQCQDCKTNCSQICPPYLILYGSGTTGGIAVSETLHLDSLKVPNFLVGCSVASFQQPAGIAGFGRGPSSLPSQLGLSKFSYCLLSHRFEDSNKNSSLVLDLRSDSDKKTAGFTYTNFVKNPKVDEKPAFSVNYYVNLRQISVGGRHVKIPYESLSPGNDGTGGTIVDSGTTFTFMSRNVFEPLSNEFISQMKDYERAVHAEALTGLRPCFNVSSAPKTVAFPELTLHFKGGADVALPPDNYFAFVGDSGAVCLTVVTDGEVGSGPGIGGSGPGIILGNFQTQNFFLEYDLVNERIGFKQQKCQ